MKITILCEGESDAALGNWLNPFVDACCREAGRPKVGLVFKTMKGTRIKSCDHIVDRLELSAREPDVLGVICLIDVHPDFKSAADAKHYLVDCVKDSEHAGLFHAHAAQMELEAWMLPFWDDIAKRLKVKKKSPGVNPEEVNHEKPPSKYLSELYKLGRRTYVKTIEAPRLFSRFNMDAAADKCAELRNLLDTLRDLCDKADT